LKATQASVGAGSAAAAAGVKTYADAAAAGRATVTSLGTSLQGTSAAIAQQQTATAAAATGIASYLPPLQAAAGGTTSFAKSLQIAGDASLSVKDKTAQLRGSLAGIKPDQVNQLADAMIQSEKASKAAGAAGAGAANGFRQAAQGAAQLTVGLRAMAMAMLKFEAVIRILQMLGGAMDFMSAATAKQTPIIKAAETAQRAFNDAVNNYGPAANGAVGAMGQVKSGVEQFREEVDALGQSSERTSGVWSTMFDTNMGMIGGVANDIMALNKVLENTPQRMAQADQVLSQYNAGLGEFNTSNIKAVAGIKEMIKAQEAEIAAAKAAYAQKKQAAGAKVSDEEQAALDALQRKIEQLIGVRDELNSKAIAVGIDQGVLDSSIQGLDLLKSAIEKAINQAEQLGKTQIEEIKAQVEVDVSQIEVAKQKLQELYDMAKQSIAANREASKQESNQRLANIESEKAALSAASEQVSARASAQKAQIQANAESAKQAVASRLASELAAIDKAMAKESAAHSRRMSNIDAQEAAAIRAVEQRASGPGSATAKLAELDALEREKQIQAEIAALRKSGDTAGAMKLEERARLEKQAAEEQKAAEEEKRKIAERAQQQRQQAEEAHAKKLADLEAQRAAKEKAAAEEQQQIEMQAKEKAAEVDRQAAAAQAKIKAEQAKLDKEAAKERDAQAKKEAEFQKQEKDLEKKFKDDMAAQDKKEQEIRAKAAEQIKGIEENIKKVKEEAAKVMGDANAAAETSLNNQLSIVRKMVAEYAKLKPVGLATGGPVSAGSSYTVNEFGKEAFLSAAGRLSMINAPSWGSWRAPTSGTVIPAHLTRLLNIPSGGINLNSGPSANVGRISRASSPLGAVLSALKYPTNGMTSDQASNITATQAQQAVAIGKLSRSVRELSRKDWNVNVSVKNGGSTNNYLHTLNTLR
jgi:hypothetical protein